MDWRNTNLKGLKKLHYIALINIYLIDSSLFMQTTSLPYIPELFIELRAAGLCAWTDSFILYMLALGNINTQHSINIHCCADYTRLLLFTKQDGVNQLLDYKSKSGTSCLRAVELLSCPTNPLKSLQLIQNAAVRVLMRTNSRYHISSVLASLHWLPVKFSSHIKLLMTELHHTLKIS